MSTPMPKHFDPFQKPPQAKEVQEKSELESPSARGTIKGVPTMLKQEVEPTAELLAAIDTPFEEPFHEPP